jgi:hypothetical protein
LAECRYFGINAAEPEVGAEADTPRRVTSAHRCLKAANRDRACESASNFGSDSLLMQ